MSLDLSNPVGDVQVFHFLLSPVGELSEECSKRYDSFNSHATQQSVRQDSVKKRGTQVIFRAKH